MQQAHRAQKWCAGFLTALLIGACAPPDGRLHQAPVTSSEPGVGRVSRQGPADAPPGSCWGRTVKPAVIESMTRQVQVAPARFNPDGSLAKPPVYRSETYQKIVRDREDKWFEAPCEELLTPDFVASLQRALSARGHYAGPANGVFDRPTRAAVQRLQRSQGLDSPVLSLQSARALGLVAADLSSLE